MTTTYDDQLAKLKEANGIISDEAMEAVTAQGKKSAANMLLMYGDKVVLTGAGFISGVMSAAEATLLWLVAEGYVELTDKALATEDELQRRKLIVTEKEGNRAAEAVTGRPGAYI